MLSDVLVAIESLNDCDLELLVEILSEVDADIDVCSDVLNEVLVLAESAIL